MSVFQGILLGILQGVAEFLPVSSSGHLAVVKNLFQLDDVPLLFDIFLHLATLAAICLYFWRKIWNLLKCLGHWISRKEKTQEDEAGLKTIVAIIISTIVTGVIGFITSKFIPELSIKVTCAGFLVTSLLLIVSAGVSKTRQTEQGKPVSKLQALVIGFMQGIGTLPGISRSGSTIAGALLSGVNQKDAGDYSFIISIPAILGAFILEIKDLGEVSEVVGAVPIIAGCAASFAVGYLSLTVLMKLIKKGKLQWFACYLIPLGILGLIFLK